MTAQATPFPLYGFVAGDVLGLVVLVRPEETVAELAHKLLEAAIVRVGKVEAADVWFRGEKLDPRHCIGETSLSALDRVDVRPRGASSPRAG